MAVDKPAHPRAMPASNRVCTAAKAGLTAAIACRASRVTGTRGISGPTRTRSMAP
jgi:hypothetical protein